MFDIEDYDRRNAMLTKDQRQVLINEGRGYKRQKRSYHYTQAVKRVRNSLMDFNILDQYLPDDRMSDIFSTEEESEYEKIRRDVARAIKFFYVGLGGESGFRGALTTGIAHGEVALENDIDYPAEVSTRFEAKRLTSVNDEDDVVDAVEEGEWGKLEPSDVFAFIREACEADAIDFEKVRSSAASYSPPSNDAVNFSEGTEYEHL